MCEGVCVCEDVCVCVKVCVCAARHIVVCWTSRYMYVSVCVASQGRHAFVGLGFEDRGDSFDFNVALQDHFK